MLMEVLTFQFLLIMTAAVLTVQFIYTLAYLISVFIVFSCIFKQFNLCCI